MTAINYTTGITADGVYVFQKFQEGKKYVFRVSGTFGAANATVGVDAAASNTALYSDGTHATDDCQVILETIARPVLNAA